MFKRGILMSKVMPKWAVNHFISRFRANYVSVDLVRIGGNGDGGYLLPNVFDNIAYCFSPGVSNITSFEGELSRRYGIKSFVADGNISVLPDSENFIFTQKNLGSRTFENVITLSDWIEQSLSKHEQDSNMILQMDIEGGSTKF